MVDRGQRGLNAVLIRHLKHVRPVVMADHGQRGLKAALIHHL